MIDINSNLLQIKSDLLCYGFNIVSKKNIDPLFFDPGFIHGSQIRLRDEIIVNVPISERFVYRTSPYLLKNKHDNHTLFKNKNKCVECEPIEMPSWTYFKLNKKYHVYDFLRPHSLDVIFYTPIKNCIFDAMGLKCKFCTFSGEEYSKLDIYQFLEKSFKAALNYNSNYEIAIGGATPNIKDGGIGFYSSIIKQIREITENPISIEILPPQNPYLLKKLYDSGANSIIMNIEIFDENIKREICPGKSIISLSKYVECWKYALKIFGKNKVSSVLIVGLEDLKSTYRGSKFLIENSIIPTLIPFRPYDECKLSNYSSTNSKDYFELCQSVSKLMNEKELFPNESDGCSKCGGCSLEGQFSGAIEIDRQLYI